MYEVFRLIYLVLFNFFQISLLLLFTVGAEAGQGGDADVPVWGMCCDGLTQRCNITSTEHNLLLLKNILIYIYTLLLKY